MTFLYYITVMEQTPKTSTTKKSINTSSADAVEVKEVKQGKPREAEPTRYGDWELSGRCIDF
jgi:hypothetical protein